MPRATLRNSHVVGVLNRSMGNDQILVDSRALRVTDGGLVLEELKNQRHTALVVKGTTGHFFLLWFLRRHGIDPSYINIEYVREYVGHRKKAIDVDDVHLISTWEPFASLAIHGRPSLRRVFDSSEGPGVVFDILVAERDRSNTQEYHERLGMLWRLYDRCLQENRLMDPKVVDRLVAKHKLDRRSYERWVQQMRFYGPDQRKAFFAGTDQDSFSTVMDRITDTWATVIDGPAVDDFAVWKRDLQDLASDRPSWLFEDLQDKDSAREVGTINPLAKEVESRRETLFHRLTYVFEHRKQTLRDQLNELEMYVSHVDPKLRTGAKENLMEARARLEEQLRTTTGDEECLRRKLRAASDVTEIEGIERAIGA